MFSLLKMFDLGGCLCWERNSISTVGAGEPAWGYWELAPWGLDLGPREQKVQALQSPGSKSWSQASRMASLPRMPMCSDEQWEMYTSCLQSHPRGRPPSEQGLSLQLGVSCRLLAPCPTQGHEETRPAARTDPVAGWWIISLACSQKFPSLTSRKCWFVMAKKWSDSQNPPGTLGNLRNHPWRRSRPDHTWETEAGPGEAKR